MADLATFFAPSVSYDAVCDLENALTAGGSTIDVRVRVPRDVAEKILSVLNLERTKGALVIPAHDEFTPANAAIVLGTSRQTVVRHIEAGAIAARRVGTHWRIPATELAAFIERDREARKAASRRLALATAE